MVTLSIRTAGISLLGLLLAVFFSATAPAADSSLTNLEKGLSELIFDVSRSVVTVESWQRVAGGSLRWSADEAVEHRISSGLICDSGNHVLVAAPMVAEYERIMVSSEHGQQPAGLVGIDFRSNLALLYVEHPLGAPVRVSSRALYAGQFVVAIGYANGLRATPSMGFCAGLRSDGNLQFTAPVPSGSVGGGVFDLSGQLLGVITGDSEHGNQTALAVPAHLLPDIIAHLKTHGDRQAGFLGVTTAEIEISPGLEVATTQKFVVAESAARRVIERGVVVTNVLPRSPAERAGLRVGDLIFSFNNSQVVSAPELAQQVIQTQPNTSVSMELIRLNTYYDLQFPIGEKQLVPTDESPRPRRSQLDQQRVVDSLARVLEQLKLQIRQVESRLRSVNY